MTGPIIKTCLDGALFSGIGWGMMFTSGVVVSKVTSVINNSNIAHFFKINLDPPTLLGPFTGLLICGTFFLTHLAVSKAFELCFGEASKSPTLITLKFVISFAIVATGAYFILGVNPLITIGVIALSLLIDKAIKCLFLKNEELWSKDFLKA